MRKLLLVLLVLAMIIPSTSISESDKAILFRGLEWGTSYQESLKAFPESFPFQGPKDFDYWHYPTEELFHDGLKIDTNFREYLGCYSYSSEKYYDSFEVAGYPVKELSMHYAYLPGEDGLLVRDIDHAVFIKAYYILTPKDAVTAFEDLTNKMTDLYGEMKQETTEGSSIIYTFRVWDGKDGTMVAVEFEDYQTSGSKYIYIRYTFKGADMLIEQAHEAVLLEERLHAESNYDGL